MQFGFRMEGVNYMPGIFASNVPFTTGAGHKEMMERFPTMGPNLTRIRDHGSGQVVLDENGQAQLL
jgi:hypothetical protein